MSKTIKGFIQSIETFGTVDGPGIRYVLFLQGCPLRCEYCHNPETWKINNHKLILTPSEVFEDFKKYINFYGVDGGITVSGGEPLGQWEFLRELFKICKENNIHTALDTSGFFLNDDIKSLLEYTDLILMDIKSLNRDIYKKITTKDIDNSLIFLNYLKDLKKDIWIRQVIIPGVTDNIEEMKKLVHFCSKIKNIKKIELLPFHILAREKYETLKIYNPMKNVEPPSKEVMNRLKAIVSEVYK
ncbi:MAG: pyruvate formate-lyase-activating protein [Fusobacteriaceae bacterium]